MVSEDISYARMRAFDLAGWCMNSLRPGGGGWVNLGSSACPELVISCADKAVSKHRIHITEPGYESLHHKQSETGGLLHQ